MTGAPDPETKRSTPFKTEASLSISVITAYAAARSSVDLNLSVDQHNLRQISTARFLYLGSTTAGLFAEIGL